MPQLDLNAWKHIGASSTVLEWVKNGVPLEFKVKPLPCKLHNVVQGHKQHEFVSKEVRDLLSNGAIQEVNEDQVYCCLPLKCVPKKRNKLRLVLDCRHLNNYIECPTFSQEGIDAVANQIETDDQLVSIDLKNGFHHVKIDSKYRKYLSFSWNNKFYVWCVLPFGVKCAPYYFHKNFTSSYSIFATKWDQKYHIC